MEKTKGHRLVLQDRGNMTITGVVKVQTVDPKEIVMETEQGMLHIKGEKLDVKQLDLQNAFVEISGQVDALIYPRGAQGSSRGNLFGKIFK